MALKCPFCSWKQATKSRVQTSQGNWDWLLSIDDCKLDAADCIYNLGGDFSYSILDMAKLIKERCEKIMGTSPEIIVGIDNVPNNAVAEPVIYNIDKIKKIGFKLVANVNEEIDRTIIFCNENKE